jgi:hypothetical protein
MICLVVVVPGSCLYSMGSQICFSQYIYEKYTDPPCVFCLQFDISIICRYLLQGINIVDRVCTSIYAIFVHPLISIIFTQYLSIPFWIVTVSRNYMFVTQF